MIKKIVTAVALVSTASFATVAIAQPANMSGIKPEGFYSLRDGWIGFTILNETTCAEPHAVCCGAGG